MLAANLVDLMNLIWQKQFFFVMISGQMYQDDKRNPSNYISFKIWSVNTLMFF